MQALRKFAGNPLSIVGAVLLLSSVVGALFAPQLTGFDPMRMSIPERLAAPSLEHPFGTDVYGRDVLSRVLHGSRVSLRVALLASLLALSSGTLVGVIAGLARGAVDNVLMRVTDVLLAFPGLLLAIGISAALGTGETSIVLALWFVYLPRFARLSRAAVLQVRDLDFVSAARALGGGTARITLKHVGPSIISPLAVQASVYFSEMILAEAALSFLGLGTPPPTPSWGNILSEGRDFMRLAPWISIFPGVAILLTVLGVNLMGDALRDTLDPRKG